MSMRPVSSALPGSRSPPAMRTKSTSAQLERQRGRARRAGPDARPLGPERDRPADQLAVRAPQVVLQLAAEAGRLVGLVGLRHGAEEHLQPARRARGALQAAVVGAPHEGLEGALALLGQQRLHRAPAAGGRWPARARAAPTAPAGRRRWARSCSRGRPRAAARGAPARPRSPAPKRSARSRIGGVGALGELGQDLGGEQLDRLADVLVAVAPGLHDEDQLVDPGRLVAPAQVAHLRGRADRPAQRARAPAAGRARRAAPRRR